MLLPGRITPNQDHQLDLQAGISFCRGTIRPAANSSENPAAGGVPLAFVTSASTG